MAGSVHLSKDDKVIRVHPIRHDRSRSAPSPTPKAAPAARTPPSDMSASCRNSPVAQVPELDRAAPGGPDAPGGRGRAAAAQKAV